MSDTIRAWRKRICSCPWFEDAEHTRHLMMCPLFDPPAGVFVAPPLEELNRLRELLNTPEIEDFDKAVPLEAAHQQERWGAPHDDGKNPEDWFWLVGYLAGKALAAMKAGDMVRAKHHTISAAAALRNWHSHIRQGWTLMRPGIEEPAGGAAVSVTPEAPA